MARGFKPVRNLDGTPWNGALRRCTLLASYAPVVCIGDLVTLTTDVATANPTGNTGEGIYPCINHAAATGVIFGVVMGFDPAGSDLSTTRREASTLRTALVCPCTATLILEAQADAAIALTQVNNSFDSNVTAVSAAGVTISLHDIDVGSTSTTASSQWQLLGPRNDPGNLATITAGSGTTATVWEVRCMEFQMGIGVASVPV